MLKYLATTCTCGFLMAASLAGAEELTEESVQAAFEDQNFINAFGQCFVGMDAPEEVTLITFIDGNGTATLSGVEPMVLAQTKTCIEGSMGYLKFPATGGEYEITYPVPVPEVVGTPTPPPDPTHPVVVATPPPTTVYAVDESQWRPLYNSGKRKILSGAVLIGLGGVAALTGLGIYGLALGSSILADEDKKTTYLITASVLAIGGLVCIIAGGVMIGKGRRDKRHALNIRDGLAFNMPLIGFGPTPDGKGGMLAAAWVF